LLCPAARATPARPTWRHFSTCLCRTAAHILITERITICWLSRGGDYLETIAVDPAAPSPPRPRWFGLDSAPDAPALRHWICRVDDIEAAVAALPEAGEITALERGDLRWRMAQPVSGEIAFDGMFPALIQWDGPDAASGLVQRGVALERLHVQHPEARRLEALLAPYLAERRLRFATGRPGLTAILRTPSGQKVLT